MRISDWSSDVCSSDLAMPNPGGVGWALLGWMLLTLAILDWRHFWLPDALTLPLAFLGLTIGLWRTDVALIDRIIGAVAGYGTWLGISGGSRLFRGRAGLGLGDVKRLGGLGGWFGWRGMGRAGWREKVWRAE